jgi:hypothetical protein
MAKFQEELPNEIIKQLEALEGNCTNIFKEMTQEGAKVVKRNVLNNMKKSFKTTKVLEGGLRVTKAYKTPSDDGINTHIGFYGYDKDSKPTKRHPKGTPIPLIAMAREYGSSRGEAKKPFFRKSFKKSEIEQVMQSVQDKHIKGD